MDCPKSIYNLYLLFYAVDRLLKSSVISVILVTEFVIVPLTQHPLDLYSQTVSDFFIFLKSEHRAIFEFTRFHTWNIYFCVHVHIILMLIRFESLISLRCFVKPKNKQTN